MYFADTLNEDDTENYAHFYGYEIGNNVISTNPLKIANLPGAVTFMGAELAISEKDVECFNAMIGKQGQAPFLPDDPKVQYLISVLKQEAVRLNKGLTPEIDKKYYCETCGSRSGECHPQTSYCFACDTDNWTPVDYTDV